MLGFVFGTLCLIGFSKVAFGHRGRWHRRWGRGYHGGGRCGGRFGGPDRALYAAFERLDTAPGQEKVIRAALTEMWEALSGLRPAVHALRKETATAFAQDGFNEAIAEERLNLGEAELARARSIVAGALSKVHGALDPDQRRHVARWMETGPGALCV
jgi:uncharacterized membrane protein